MAPDILITLIVVVGIIAIAWWAFKNLDLPPPIRMVGIIVVALVAIWLLLSLLHGGAHFGSLCG